MAGSAYERLMAWSKTEGRKLEVSRATASRSGEQWSIKTSVVEPVNYSAYGYGSDIDEAASKVIRQLETVGVRIE